MGSASLALVDHSYSDGATKKMPYGVDVFTTISIAPHLFLLGWLKLMLFIVRSVKTGLGR